MKRVIFGILLLVSSGAGHCLYHPKVTESHSGFDNSRIVDLDTASAGCEKAFLTIDCSGFGAQWNSAEGDKAIVSAMTTGVRAILRLEFNADGDKQSLSPIGIGYTEKGGDPKVSIRDFSASMDYLRKLAKADKAWMRICFKDGCREYDIKAQKDGSLAYRGLLVFVHTVDNPGSPDPLKGGTHPEDQPLPGDK